MNDDDTRRWRAIGELAPDARLRVSGVNLRPYKNRPELFLIERVHGSKREASPLSASRGSQFLDNRRRWSSKPRRHVSWPLETRQNTKFMG